MLAWEISDLMNTDKFLNYINNKTSPLNTIVKSCLQFLSKLSLSAVEQTNYHTRAQRI